ncbi:MAG: KilA-N domain-containing protein, partial [Spirochaetaceae bacterium]|nr:KilA-N domain-containing protein [Spirochaetaceae bacterium]
MVKLNMSRTNKMLVSGLEVGTKPKYGNVYISLTDIARLKNPKDPRFIVYSWMKSKETVMFLGLWEALNNPGFNRVGFDTVKNEAGLNSFSLAPKEWAEKTNAIGIVAVAGKYDSGIFAHEDIAFEFASWVSSEFKLYLIQEYKRLKINEQTKLAWDAKRELARINYHIHTDAIKENLILPKLTQLQKSFVYA